MMTEFRPGSFQILPTVIKNLLIINVLVFLAQIVYDGLEPGGDLSPQIGVLTNTFALHSIESNLFKPWQVVTHMFMHGGLMHIFGNMFALWMFGSILENIWGPRRFLLFYIVCGIGAAIIHMASLSWEYHSLFNDFRAFKEYPSLTNFSELMNDGALTRVNERWVFERTRNWPTDPVMLREYAAARLDETSVLVQDIIKTPTLGASGAVFGCLAAFGYLFPNTYIYLYFFIPLKAKWFVMIYIAFELTMALQHSAGGIARWAHLGGALVGFLLVFFWNRTKRKTLYR